MSLMQDLFVVLHPEWVGDQQKFEDWLKLYDEHCLNKWGRGMYDLCQSDHLNQLSAENRQRYYKLMEQRRKQSRRYVTIQLVQRTVRFQRWKAFSKATSDLLMLLWSVVLTRKWKICPLVELPDQNNAQPGVKPSPRRTEVEVRT
ncbi:hypothetical protein CYG49_04040 [Candidatus Saccharibacteria bacterium]|nr:MAG: hypothetical protein CYG49_04040 [Candidatus Saccharibacteria bacterium]